MYVADESLAAPFCRTKLQTCGIKTVNLWRSRKPKQRRVVAKAQDVRQSPRLIKTLILILPQHSSE